MWLWVQLGPNVSIGAHVRVGAGVRLLNAIVLDEVEIGVRPPLPGMWNRLPALLSLALKTLGLLFASNFWAASCCSFAVSVSGQENAIVMNSIVGWKSQIGRWSRVQVCLVSCSLYQISVFTVLKKEAPPCPHMTALLEIGTNFVLLCIFSGIW